MSDAQKTKGMSPPRNGPNSWLLIGVVAAVLLGVAGYTIWGGNGDSDKPRRAADLPDAQLTAVAESVAKRVRGDGSEDIELETSADGPSLAYVALRSQRRKLGEAWAEASKPDAAVEQAIDKVLQEMAADKVSTIDVVQLDVGYGFREIPGNKVVKWLDNAHRGVRGLEVRLGEGEDRQVIRFAPSAMVASNLNFKGALKRAAQKLGTDVENLEKKGQFRSFESHQLLVYLEDEPRAVEMFRGNQIIPQSSVDQESIQQFADLMAQWMIESLNPDGRMVYMYYPATGREGNGNNMIRQWMATLCLSRIAVARNDAEVAALAAKNIEYNLSQFYKEEEGLGVIEYRGKVKLGAVALAALSMVEHPDAAKYKPTIDKLLAMTDHLWREDGSFQTFYRPAERSKNPNLNNFYPGETLLLWGTLLTQADDPVRQEKFMKSFEYYRKWHMDNRKPAFVPWHTQAYYLMWKKTGDEALKEWTFEMNDWLIDNMQMQSRVAYDDTLGRFYDRRRKNRHYGPPHASSTGVYMEGLIDAFRMARESGDEARQERYRRSMLEGIRSSMQIQFQDSVDAFYVQREKEVQGGLRTTVYNSVIRVDNTQHTLMGVMKILREFEPADFKH